MVHHDDYDYSKVSEHLPEHIREFVLLCCGPPTTSAPHPTLLFLATKINYSLKVSDGGFSIISVAVMCVLYRTLVIWSVSDDS